MCKSALSGVQEGVRFCASALVLLVLLGSVCLLAQEAVVGGSRASFQMAVELRSSTVKPGAEVWLDIRLTNVSDELISLWSVRRGPPVYAADVLDREGKPAPLTEVGLAFRRGDMVVRREADGRVRMIVGGSGRSVVIAPGESGKDFFLVSEIVDLRAPGTYWIRLERVDPATKVTVRSNTVTLNVADETPAER